MTTPALTAVIPMASKRLLLRFATGEAHLFDVRPYLAGGAFAPLVGEEYFRQVQLAGSAVRWPGGQQIPPAELYGGGIALR